MSFLRVSTTGVDVPLADLGYTLADPVTNFVISDQFSVEDLENSANLAAAIQAGTLTAQVLLDGVWTSISAVDFDSKDVPSAHANMYEIANTVDNQRLVNGSDSSSGTQLHHHDARYYTESELNAVTGAGLIGADDSGWTYITGADVQSALDSIDGLFGTAVTLDSAYDNDADGILDVDGASKPLIFRSNNTNDVVVNRTNGVDTQDAVRVDVSANEIILGSLAVGGLAQMDVHVLGNVTIDGSITLTGTITDTTVNELNVANADIRLRDGATGIAGADAAIIVERGTSGADANLRWNEASDRWMAGLQGSDQTIALLEADEVVTGVWDMQGGGATEPNFYLTSKAAAPTVSLGSASQYPIANIAGILSIYDKSNSRNKFLSVAREYMVFTGRDSAANSNEYARMGLFTSNQSSNRLIRNATLVGISANTTGSETWTVRVRKNGNVTNLASLALTAVAGSQDGTFNVDFNAGDKIEVFIDGTNIDRPVIKLEFAYRF